METTIHYVYSKTTGEFAGSGVTPIDDEHYGSTTIAPPDLPEVPQPVLAFDGDAWKFQTP